MSDKTYIVEFVGDGGKIAVLKLGENVLGGNDALEFAEATEELRNKGAELIIADLKKVNVMNSSGLGMLVSSLSNLKNNDVDFVLSSVPKKVMSLLEMTHLDKVFSIYNSVEDAAEHQS